MTTADVTLVRNARFAIAWDAAAQRHVYRTDVDLAFAGREITHLGPGYAGPAPARVIDGAELMVMPGLVDIHAHPFSEPLNKGMWDEVGSRNLYNTSLYEYLTVLRPDPDGIRACYGVALAELLLSGVTTLCDLSVPSEGWLDTLAASGLRVCIAPMFRSGRWFTRNGHLVEYEWNEQAGREAFDIALREIDKAAQHPSGRLSGMVAPSQIDTCTPELLRDAHAESERRRLPFQVHTAQSLSEFHAQNSLQLPFLFLAALSRDAERLGDYGTAIAAMVATQNSSPSLTPEDVDLAYRIILQRRPESSQVVQLQVSAAKTPLEIAWRLICSTEWSQQINGLFRAAFPGVARLWHCHAPKTGGSAFFDAAQRAGWGYINTNLLEVAGQRLHAVAEAVRYLDRQSVLVSGHRPVWQSQPAIGPFDNGIMFVRDPVERLVSYFNFASDVVAGRENVQPGDSKPFLDKGYDPTSFEKTYLAGFFEVNEMCFYLSANRTCRDAMRALREYEIELAIMDDASEFCQRYFGVAAAKINASTKTLKVTDVAPALAQAIIAENAEDLALYNIALSRRRVDGCVPMSE